MTTVLEELEAIREEHDGLLRAEDVVEFAQSNPESALHKRFTWDDGLAAHQYRLMQARQVIRVHVFTPEMSGMTVKTYVSLLGDRMQPGGGYRRLDDVFANVELRRQLLNQALKEARLWQQKFKALEELMPIFAALDTVQSAPITTTQPEALNLVA